MSNFSLCRNVLTAFNSSSADYLYVGKGLIEYSNKRELEENRQVYSLLIQVGVGFPHTINLQHTTINISTQKDGKSL